MDTTALSRIENGLLDGEATASLLRKVIIFGGQVGSHELRSWASQELNGYPQESDLPDYRKILAGLFADAVVGRNQIRGQSIEPWQAQAAIAAQFPDFKVNQYVELRQPIAEIEALAAAGETVRMAPGWAALARENFDKGQAFQQTTAIYYQVTPASLRGLLDRVATELANFVAELRSSMPAGTETPSPDAVSSAVFVTINGGTNSFSTGSGSPVTYTTIHVVQGNRESLDRELVRLGIPAEEIDQLHEAMDENQLEPTDPGSKVQSWLRRIKSGTVAGTGKIITGAIGGLAARAVAAYYGWA